MKRKPHHTTLQTSFALGALLVFSMPLLAQTALQQGKKFLASGDSTKAVVQGKKAVVEEPNNPEAHYLLGCALDEEEKFDEAVEELKVAKKLYTDKSNTIKVSQQIGKIYLNRGQLDKSELVYNEILESSSVEKERGSAFEGLALVYQKKSSLSQALAKIEEAIKAYNSTKDTHNGAIAFLIKGAIMTDAKKFPDAHRVLLDGLKGVITAKDDYWAAIGNEYLGNLADAEGDKGEAISRYHAGYTLADKMGDEDLKASLASDLTAMQQEEKARVFAAIDVGSTGVKLQVMEITPQASGQSKIKVLYNSTINPNLLESMNKADEFSEEAMTRAGEAVRTLVEKMNIAVKEPITATSIAGSSGLQKARNLPAFAQKMKAITGLEMTFISSKMEQYYDIVGAMPFKDRYISSLLDIGSSNGRIGYFTHGANGIKTQSIEIPLGTKVLAAAAKENKEGGEYPDALQRVIATQLAENFKKQLDANPELKRRKKLYIVGGAIWALTTIIHPNKVDEAYVSLSAEDFEKFYSAMTANLKSPFEPDYGEIADAEQRQRAEDQTKSVHKVFTAEQLAAAASLLRMVMKNGSLAGQNLYFSRFGGWASGMAQVQYYARPTDKTTTDKTKAP